MARALSKVAQKYVKNPEVKLKNRTRDYTREPGSHGRGDSDHLWDCLSCAQGRHQECEGWEMVMCRCWRTKHTNPPPPRGRSPIRERRVSVPVVANDDEIEWDEVISNDDDLEWDDV